MQGPERRGRCGKGEALQEFFVGATVAWRKFGGPEPTGAEITELYADAPAASVPQGTEQARLAGFFWQYARRPEAEAEALRNLRRVLAFVDDGALPVGGPQWRELFPDNPTRGEIEAEVTRLEERERERCSA